MIILVELQQDLIKVKKDGLKILETQESEQDERAKDSECFDRKFAILRRKLSATDKNTRSLERFRRNNNSKFTVKTAATITTTEINNNTKSNFKEKIDVGSYIIIRQIPAKSHQLMCCQEEGITYYDTFYIHLQTNNVDKRHYFCYNHIYGIRVI